MKIFNCIKWVLVFAFIVPINVFAISGACSWHGGVNCSGPSYSGNAMCNDGWESSTNYNNADECKTYCSRPIATGCTTQSQLEVVRIEGITSGRQRYSPTMAQGELSVCQDQINQYQADLATYNTCLSLQNSRIEYVPPTADDETASCKSEFGLNAIVSPTKSGYCVCKSGYQWSTDRTECVAKSYEQVCKERFGLHSVWGGTYVASNGVNIPNCECGTGYAWNTNKTECAIIPTEDLQITNPITTAQPPEPVVPTVASPIIPTKTQETGGYKKPETKKGVPAEQQPEPIIKKTPKQSTLDQLVSEAKGKIPLSLTPHNLGSSTEDKPPVAQTVKTSELKPSIFAKYQNWYKKISTKIWGYFPAWIR